MNANISLARYYKTPAYTILGFKADNQFVNKDADFYKLDIRSEKTRELINSLKPEIIFHLAAQTHPPTSFTDPIGTWQTNVMGSINLITSLLDYQPICDNFIGTNNKEYQHVFYIGKYTSDNKINKINKNNEIDEIRWCNLSDSINLIRSYNQSKIDILTKLFCIIANQDHN